MSPPGSDRAEAAASLLSEAVESCTRGLMAYKLQQQSMWTGSTMQEIVRLVMQRCRQACEMTTSTATTRAHESTQPLCTIHGSFCTIMYNTVMLSYVGMPCDELLSSSHGMPTTSGAPAAQLLPESGKTRAGAPPRETDRASSYSTHTRACVSG